MRAALDGGVDALLDAAAQDHRVGAGGDVAHAFVDHGLREDGRGGRPVAGDVVRLGRDFLRELGAEVLEAVLDLDLLRDRHAVVGDDGAPHFFSRTTLRPLGPRVILTALARRSTPSSRHGARPRGSEALSAGMGSGPVT